MTRPSNLKMLNPLRLFPARDRNFKRRRDWVPLVLTMVLVGGVVWSSVQVAHFVRKMPCLDAFPPSPDIWSQDGECVGVSAGPFSFKQPSFEAIMKVISEENASDHPQCGNRDPVTVGFLATLTSPVAGVRARYELEGLAAAQWHLNNEACTRPIVLRIGHMGANEQAAVGAARALADHPDVLAVVGLGLSLQPTADAADLLADRGIPMVADLVTAEGFDQRGSHQDAPDFSACRGDATYTDGIADGFFYRLAFRNHVQIAQLSAQLNGHADFVITPTDRGDPSTCTALPAMERAFTGRGSNRAAPTEERFDPRDDPTVTKSVTDICNVTGDVSVAYAARALHLGRFLSRIAERYASRSCDPSSIVVASLSDATRMRAPEADDELERLRTNVLGSAAFADGRLRLVYTPLADPDLPRKNPREFEALERAMDHHHFARTDLDGAWAINAYDSLTMISTAIGGLAEDGFRIDRGTLNTRIKQFTLQSPVHGAGGDLAFDGSGNRLGDPVVVRLCPAAARADGPDTKTLSPPTSGPCPG